jgi:hypothetical protein
MSCHSNDGKHAIAVNNGIGLFTSKSWWPSAPGVGPGWCDPAHLRLQGYIYHAGGAGVVDLSCHSDDGKHVVAINNLDGTFTPSSWWPSAPGVGAGWCDPAHLEVRDYSGGAMLLCRSTAVWTAVDNDNGSFNEVMNSPAVISWPQ